MSAPEDTVHDDLANLSLNQITTKRRSLNEAVRACVAAGIPAIGVWRDEVEDLGTARAARLVRDAGLTVTTLCRGGLLTAPDRPSRRAAVEDNQRAIDTAADLGASTLVLVAGGLPAGAAAGICEERERVSPTCWPSSSV
ncbi:sugar phosphate isomerase/epimerase [Amycolatopsis sp. CA-128772]|uniref:sugar phosphate isomerase/epimerase family protein n=1 Tax=Amycolatopsis sp. CA-128772 TaxID=2073159 RepID=UPI001304FB9E|nr:TIM barrel protein [Amycolatopsis sp. CA-128772]